MVWQHFWTTFIRALLMHKEPLWARHVAPESQLHNQVGLTKMEPIQIKLED